jgi:hypothetical protein
LPPTCCFTTRSTRGTCVVVTARPPVACPAPSQAARADAVHACPWFHPSGAPRARTYDGQRPPRRSLPSAYAQLSSYVAASGQAVCKTADAYRPRLRLGRPARWLGSDDGSALCSPGLSLARLCWLLLHLDLRRRVSGQARVWWWLPLQARARSAAFDRLTSRYIQLTQFREIPGAAHRWVEGQKQARREDRMCARTPRSARSGLSARSLRGAFGGQNAACRGCSGLVSASVS